jgi:nucleoside phosphorylase
VAPRDEGRRVIWQPARETAGDRCAREGRRMRGLEQMQNVATISPHVSADMAGLPFAKRNTSENTMTKTIHVSQLRGRIDFAIITIREDEFEAVLKRLEPRIPVVGGKQLYEYCKLGKRDGRFAGIAVVRAYDQGQSVAQSVARDIIEDLCPRWLILTGIAGGFPDGEFTLGDVLLASSLHDLSITAAIEGKPTEYRPSGGPVHPAVERFLGNIPAWRNRLGGWNLDTALGMSKPQVDVPEDIHAECYYGANDIRTSVRDSLQKHFPPNATARPPLYKVAALATANVLVKDTALSTEWRRCARQICQIEMEAGGVYMAARHAQPNEVPLLSIRGISDIVGFRRASAWTQYACDSAASFLHALLITLPTEYFVNQSTMPLPAPEDRVSNVEWLTRLINVGYETAAAWTTALFDRFTRRAVQTPSLEAILAGFQRSSRPLLSRVVFAGDRIQRPEIDILNAFLTTGTHRVMCLLGGPGSGKTALLALFAQHAIESKMATLAIKADLLTDDAPFETWGRNELGREISAIDAIKVVSRGGKVLVVIDQLDALSATVDLKSDRLNAVLAFIDECSRLPNVSVVCSCRQFDFYRDARFTVLDPEIVDLSLPLWEDVAKHLTQRGVEGADTLPLQFREVLRVPQHLSVYLRHCTARGSASSFVSYYLMLDDLWSRETTTEDREVLYALTEYLVNEELLWAPLVRFEQDMNRIKALEAKHILQVEGRRVGFQHQTLLEHAKARLFTKTGKSLTSYVLERQSAILVRPTVWVVLQYLRDAHRDKYRLELDSILASELRLHLQYLMIEFLGQVNVPEDYEIAYLADRLLTNDYRHRVLIAVRASAEWFRALLRSHFPIIMASAAEGQWQMIGVIADGWDIDRDACLELIERFWLPDSGKDQMTWRAMNELGKWDERSVEIVVTLVRRSILPGERLYWAEFLVSSISADKPELAPRVFLEVVTREYPVQDDSGDSSPHRAHSPLESQQGWYDLPDVADAAPLEFLKVGWSWLVKMCEKYHPGYRMTVVNRYTGSCFALDHRENRRDAPILNAFCDAIAASADQSPDEFVSITEASWASENAVVHRLIIRGLCLVVQKHPGIGLRYFSEDARRFELGDHESHEQSDSIALIDVMVPGLTPDQRLQLEQLIFQWNRYLEGVDVTEDRDEWNQEARLRLFSAFREELLSAETAKWVHAARKALPEWNAEGGSTRAGFVREIPPVSKEEMLTAPTSEIVMRVSVCQESDPAHSHRTEVEGGWEEPGGPFSAGKEIAGFAKDYPQKAVEVIKGLVANHCEEAASAAIHDLSDTSLTDEEVFALVREIAAPTPQSEQLRSDTSYLLYQRCKKRVGLPDDICSLLKQWLSHPWDSTYGVATREDSQSESTKSDSVDSVLWGSGSFLLDTDRSFWTLLAMTYGYLMRVPAETSLWLDALEQHVQRNTSERTWAAYCSELRWIQLRGCDQNRGKQIIEEVFRRFPVLRTRHEGIRLVAQVANLLSATFLQEFLDSLLISDEVVHRQAFGELLALIALQDKHHDWAGKRLQLQLSIGESLLSSHEPERIGIAFTASHLWEEPESRLESSAILCKLIPNVTNRIGRAMGTVFWARDDFVADEATEVLLKALANNPACFRAIPVVDLAEHLSGLLPHKRGLVLSVCNAIVKSGRKENDLFEAGAHLVKIAITLQRFPDTRIEGLSLFEEFLRLGLDDAYSTLREIDIRPTTGKQREPRRRRRRRRN